MAAENLVWLRAFVNCIIRGDTHYEKYLELVGPGGSGKSTFTRILDTIVGAEGVLVSSLNALDKDKFEVACLHGKRLLLMPDQERYQGNYSTLKAITGHDKLRFEVKGMQRNGNDFYANVFAVCTANEPLNGTDLTSGILRRRRVIGMCRSRISCDTLIGSEEGGTLWSGLVDFWWWCIRMEKAEVESEMTKQLVVDENMSDSPVLGWAIQSLERTACTVNNRISIKVLHRSYVKWCKASAFEALRYSRFNHLLVDTLQHQLNWDIMTGIVNDEPFCQGIKFKESREVPLAAGL
jgi:putative DNA primase/helicase